MDLATALDSATALVSAAMAASGMELAWADWGGTALASGMVLASEELQMEQQVVSPDPGALQMAIQAEASSRPSRPSPSSLSKEALVRGRLSLQKI